MGFRSQIKLQVACGTELCFLSFESPFNVQNSAQHRTGTQEMVVGSDGHGWKSEGGWLNLHMWVHLRSLRSRGRGPPAARPLQEQRPQPCIRGCRTVYIAAMATDRFRRCRKCRVVAEVKSAALGGDTSKVRAESERREMGPVNPERLRQRQARQHGRESEGKKAALAPGSGAAELPAQSSRDYGGRAGPSPSSRVLAAAVRPAPFGF